MSWRQVSLRASASIADAMRLLDETAMQIVLVTGTDDRFLGTITDGDIRRALLGGTLASDPVSLCMNTTSVIGPQGMKREVALDLMCRLAIKSIPLVNADRRVVDLLTLEELIRPATRDTPVLIMAGGRGERLRPLTDEIPKPLLRVAGEPLLEILIRRLVSQGFGKIWIAVGYRADDIVNAIGDGAAFGSDIRYIHEKEPLGTAGAVKEIPDLDPGEAVLVCNADVIHSGDFGALVEFHEAKAASATVSVTRYVTEVPFAVVNAAGGYLVDIKEKPQRQDMVSMGVNVLTQEAFKLFPNVIRVDMPEIIEALLLKGYPVAVHEIQGYWLDIGTQDSLVRATFDGASEVSGV